MQFELKKQPLEKYASEERDQRAPKKLRLVSSSFREVVGEKKGVVGRE